MENPFVFGEAVTEKNFCDREEEIKKLKREISDSQKIFLASPRRFGKTSLLKNVLRQLKPHLITVFLDIEGFASYKDFLDAYLSSLTRETAPAEKILNFIRQVVPGLRINLEMDELGQPSLSLGYEPASSELNKVASQIYALPEIIAKKRKEKMVVVFDEFQEILKLKEKNIEGMLRAEIQHQRHVAYVFAGSQRRLLTDMVTSRDRPFYKVGPLVNLKKIPKELFSRFLKSKFKAGGIEITNETMEKVLGLSEEIPYFAQMFCHELWDLAGGGGKVENKDIQVMLDQLLPQHSSAFYLEWGRMNLSRRKLLRAIALSGGNNILSQAFLKKNDLGLPSSVRRTLLALMDDGYLDRENGDYFFTDILFREWIKRNPGQQL